jgi:exopolysaccharide biosynthesis polyprenyl glycosylphosphotransferase
MNSKLDKLTPGIAAKLNLVFDLILVALALHLATKETPFFTPGVLSLLLVAAIVWVFGAAVMRHYSPATPRGVLDTIALGMVLVAGLTTALVVWRRFLPDAPSFSPLAFFGVGFCWTTASRFLLFRPLRRIAEEPDDVIIVGCGEEGRGLYERLTRGEEEDHRRVVGFVAFADDDVARPLPAPLLGKAEDVLSVVADHPVEEIYVAGRPMDHAREMQTVVRDLEEVGMPFALPLHAMSFQRAKLLGDAPTDDGYLHYLSTESKPAQWALKRLVDIVCSAAALLVLSPLLVGVAIAIKITSPGPVFFKQVRVGLHGAKFNLLKFRSMVVDADALKDQLLAQNEHKEGPVFKMKNDPRITSIGRFIRKYSIDELPQLVNILRGDMTIVGPRPAVPREVVQYKAWQRRRLSVRPGLTCTWQVSGRNEIPFEQWMRMDLQYVDQWSLAMDAALILKTVPVVLTGKGAS